MAESSSSPSQGPVVRLSSVSITHPDAPGITVLEGVDWEVHAGEFWVVAGVQGSGKTALLEAAAGLKIPSSGEVELFGKRVTGQEGDASASQRRRLGMVFEGGGRLFQQLTVAENVALPLRYHLDGTIEDVRDEVLPLLELFGLDRMANVIAGRLSRVWAQRVALARALALKPELLMLDNPLAGLDVHQARWWRQFVRQLATGHPQIRSTPTTVIVACDDLRPWMDLGHRFVLTHDRRWRVLGSRAEVLESSEELVRDLISTSF
jgi:ABC-type transporter Mla maintaining outer membrane lipid asymmetry ATPase subunit MlaF